MKKLLQKILAFGQRKGLLSTKKVYRRKGVAYGFTLIELLVAALIASLMVGIMLSFLVGVLDSDRKETAKSNAQEELQAAISYIADDMQEAVYIYGSEALAGINSQLPHTQATSPSTECNPTTNTCTPILVFWKRYVYNPLATGTYSKTGVVPPTQIIGCMPYRDPTNCASNSAAVNPYQTTFGRDTYTFSLVAYYLKSDDPNITGNTGSTWSNTARILRWELRDGYVWYCSTGGTTTDTANCPTTTFTTRLPTNTSSLITSPVALVDTTNYFISPSKGFNRPDFASAGTLSTLASAWKKFDNFDFTTNPFVTLVDFMDDTTYDNAGTQGGNLASAGTGIPATATAAIKIPIGKNVTISGVGSPTNLDCDDPSVGVGNSNPASATNVSGSVTQRVPNDFSNADGTNPSGLSSFYACVTPESVTARVYLRGNAIARLANPPVTKNKRLATNSNITFFPTADVRSFGRSAIGLKKK